jgi:hypothetical protein
VTRRIGSKQRRKKKAEPARGPEPSRARELARNLALLVATLLLFGLVAEAALRVMVGTESNWFGNTTATDEYYLRVRRNSWGFRDVKHDPAKKEGVTRIAMVGDSFVFGVPIEDDEKIFPRLLQKKLGERYELISVAFPGANTAQEIRLLAEADRVYGFDHAILFFFPNDVEREGDPRGLSFYGHLIPGEAGKYLFSHSRFYYFLETRTRRLQERLGVRASYGDYLKSLYREGSPEWAAHRQLLGEFLRSAGERVTIVIIPVLYQLDDYPFAMVHDYVKGLARANGVTVIDLLDAFKGMDARDLVVNPYDFHFNEKAHVIVADYLRRELEKQGFR